MANEESDFYHRLSQFIGEGFNRQTEINSWLAGEGPRTAEEEEIASNFGGPNAQLAAQQTISLHRRNQALEALGGNSDLTGDEQLTFGGPMAESHRSLASGLDVASQLLQYLSGDPEASLTIPDESFPDV